jgi:3-(3-hydroxy-phenyl)propionate hydroxylase
MTEVPDYQELRFDSAPSADETASMPANHPVIVVGAGPVGLSCAIDLAQRGTPVLLLDEDDRLSYGSRAVCFAKRTLEIFDRLGCGQRMVEKGVSWQVGKVFLGEALIYQFDLLAEAGHKRPAFINLQQYYVEGYLVERASALPNLQLRWKNRVIAIDQDDDGVSLEVETPRGSYRLHADYLIACDGARSAIRGALGLTSSGQSFDDRFLIADLTMQAPFPSERWFWFDPPFHPRQTALLHKQPDKVWRLDFQLGRDADPVREREPKRVAARVRAALGEDVVFELVWVSVYTFSCVRMERFRHRRVIFAGDAAHGVSPFGARGANSGVQDAENLAWKLDAVLRRAAPEGLLDSYDAERIAAAEENILNSTRATDFISPKSPLALTFRDAVLALAKHAPFARKLLNSGRLSVPTVYHDSPLNSSDDDAFSAAIQIGAPLLDAPLQRAGGSAWLVDVVPGEFCLLYYAGGEFGDDDRARLESLASAVPPIRVLVIAAVEAQLAPGIAAEVYRDAENLLQQRYDLRPGDAYLLRPDQHVCARWRGFDPARALAAQRRALGWPA